MTKKIKIYRMVGIVLAIFFIIAASVVGVFINQPSFGRKPSGARLERMMKSPHYRDGQFLNLTERPQFTSDKSKISSILEFLFRKQDGLRPDTPINAIKTDLSTLNRDEDLFIWFGHSSYFLQLDGKRFLVDPVFCQASPVSFFNKPFKGTDIYKPEDMPDIDYLVITHDHWDHLDYETVMRLKEKTKKILCPLGVGEYFEYWGFDKSKLVELDWNESAMLEEGFRANCLTTHHFSGRGLSPNGTLWGSYMLQTPSQTIYIGGDGGYGTHFAEIGKRFPEIDFAFLENGQYNEDWKYIHLMPDDLIKASQDLNAKQVIAVHNSKYALAKHRWDEPQQNVARAVRDFSLPMTAPTIGKIMYLNK